MTQSNVSRVGSLLATLALGASVAGCSASATSPYPQTQVNPVSGSLELAVGTANVYGDVTGSTNIGLNVVETFRQAAGGQTPGDTDALVTTPSISGPFTLPSTAGTPDSYGATIETGPGPTDAGTSLMSGTAQPNPGDQVIASSTFGVSTNASGSGLEPYNYTSVNGNNAGTPLSYVPYTEPLFDPNSPAATGTDMDTNAFVPWGGPPAYDPNGTGLGVRDGSVNPPGVEGVSLGLDVFEHVTPVAGTYTINVVVPTGTSTTATKSATASIGAGTILPAISPATVVPDANNDGGAQVSLTLPAGVTEALVNIEDIGPDDATSSTTSWIAAPVYYTLEFTSSGTIALPPTIGPGTGKGMGSPSICTASLNTAANGGAALDGDEFFVQTLGFDYPAYEISYPQSKGKPSPIPSGIEADITISSSSNCTQEPTVACSSAAAPDALARKYAGVRRKLMAGRHIIR